jgi:hypothetical protein
MSCCFLALAGACLRMLTKDNCADEGYNSCNCNISTSPEKYGGGIFDEDIHKYFE